MSATAVRLRWLAPVVAAGVVAAGVALPKLADASSAADKLPERSAAQLLSSVSTAQVDGFSGTVVATSRLGLPALPSGSSGGGAVSLPGLLSGSTTARVWASGEDKQRVAVDAPFAEYDVVRSGRDVHTYDSASKKVVHLTLPERGAQTAPTPGVVSPQTAAQAVLSMIEPSTTVTVGRSAMVANRPAYELVLTPKDPGTLVGSVRLAVDGSTSMALRMQVFAKRQADPALEIGYTSVSFSKPDDSVFAFSPPAGAKVVEKALPAPGSPASRSRAPEASMTEPDAMPTVLGKDWTSVLVLKGVTVPKESQQLVAQLSKPVTGGRAITSALVSVLLTDDGRVLVGAVPAERLSELAGK